MPRHNKRFKSAKLPSEVISAFNAKLLEAAVDGDVKEVASLLNAGADKEARNPEVESYSALHWSALKGHRDVVRLLLNIGVDVDARDDNGRSALHYSCVRGHEPVARLLIKGCAIIDAVDKEGLTPLMVTSQKGYNKIILLLIKNNAQVEFKSVLGITALHYASLNGHVATTEMLIKHGASADSASPEGVTPLMYASGEGKPEMVSLLILYGADVNAVTIKGNSSLTRACDNGYICTAKILIKEGADVNRKTKVDIAPLWIASYEGFVDIVETVLQNGAQKNVTNDSWQATHAAAEQDHLKVLIKLNEYGCDLNAVTYQNNDTPLHLTVVKSNIEVAKWLIVNGANLLACDKDGNTPIQLAYKKGYRELASFMINFPTEKDSTSSPSAEASNQTNHECVVCKEPRTSTVLTLPCRHAVTCQKCTDEMEKRGTNQCPLCRTIISQRITIFLN